MSREVFPHTTLTVQAGTRPLRVAYLIDPDAFDGDRVDAITESALGHWGGRYRGLFPLTDGQIPPACWPVLEALDPDSIVTFQPLGDELTRRLTRRVLPYEIVEARMEPPLAGGGRWNFLDPTHGVDIFGVPRALAQSAGAAPAPRILNIHERDGRNPQRSFILRNFGLYPPIVAAQGSLEGVPHVDIPAHEIVPATLLRELARLGYDTISPLALAAVECPLLQLPFAHDGLFDDLHIVVGTTVRDAMLAWNRALHTGGRHQHKTLWVPLTLLADEDSRAALVGWLNRTGWRQDPNVCLVSYEHRQEELEPVAAALRAQLYSFIRCTSLQPDDYPFPALQQVERRWIDVERHFGGTRTVTEHVNFADGIGSIGVASPPLLDPQFNQGDWMIDVLIPHRPENYGHTNVRPSWALPKRPNFGPSFFSGVHKARITWAGLPSACINSTTGRLQLCVPTDRELFYWCIAPRQVIAGGGEPQRPVFSDFRASDVGRRLRGMIQVFGGLYQAWHFLRDPFWRDTLLHMSGERRAAAVDRAQRIEATLQTFLTEHGTAIDAANPALGLTRLRGHLPRGGYDVQHGQDRGAPGTAQVHG